MNRFVNLFASSIFCLFASKANAAVFEFDFWGDYLGNDEPAMSGSFLLDTLSVDKMDVGFSYDPGTGARYLETFDVSGGVQNFSVDIAGIGTFNTPQSGNFHADGLGDPANWWINAFWFSFSTDGYLVLDDLDISSYSVTQAAWMASADPFADFLDAVLSPVFGGAVWGFVNDDVTYAGNLHLDGRRITPVPAPTVLSLLGSVLAAGGLVRLLASRRYREKG